MPDDEIVKAFEISKDKHVVLTDEDFEAVKAEGVKTIDISDFVPYEEIDPIYFDRTYFLGPQDGAEKVYALMREAMEQTGLAAIGKYVMRERQYLGCLRVRDGVIALEKMFFHDEIRPSKDLAPGKRKVPKEELELATTLIERFTGTFEPEKYEDTYRKALLAVVRAKQKGKTITAAEPEARGGAGRPARRAEGIGRRREEEPGLGAREAAACAQAARRRARRAKRYAARACGSRRRGGPCPARRPALIPRRFRWRCSLVFTNRCASLPKRALYLTQPSWGSADTSITAVPSESRVPAGRFAFEMSKST